MGRGCGNGGRKRERVVEAGVNTNLWHLDLGLLLPGAVVLRNACDGQAGGPASACVLKIQAAVGPESVLARACPRRNGEPGRALEG